MPDFFICFVYLNFLIEYFVLNACSVSFRCFCTLLICCCEMSCSGRRPVLFIIVTRLSNSSLHNISFKCSIDLFVEWLYLSNVRYRAAIRACNVCLPM